ncbi:hypothetical protein WNY37_15880 [Henriciella sp. AS95]|uniref:hypothetical protein n=1 Tax=Henriciella sp. AS95 TaxID=3135782 RepID=UPI00317D750D
MTEWRFRFRSAPFAVIAWIMAGPLTPIYSVWILWLSKEYGFSSPEDWEYVRSFWYITGLPSTIAVSLGYFLFLQLQTKTQRKTAQIVIVSAIVVWLGTIACVLFQTSPDASFFFEQGLVFAFLSVVPAGWMTFVSWTVVRAVGLSPIKPELGPEELKEA